MIQRTSIGSTNFLRGLLYAFPAVTFTLGTWQIYRHRVKHEFKARLADSLASNGTIRISDIIKKHGATSWTKDHDLVKVVVEGNVEDSVAVGPRVLNGQTGSRLVSLVRTYDGELLAVDRGWFKDPDTVVPKQTRFTGILRKSESPTWYIREPNSPAKDQFTALIPKDLDPQAVPAFYIQELLLPDTYDQEEPRTDQLPERFRLKRPTPEAAKKLVYDKHLEYIITWYSLCAASLFMISKGAAGRKLSIIKSKSSRKT